MATVALAVALATQGCSSDGQPAPGVPDTTPTPVETTQPLETTSSDLTLLSFDPGMYKLTTRAVSPGEDHSTVAALLYNPGAKPVKVEAWEALHSEGLSLTGVRFAPNVQGFSPFGGLKGFPPEGIGDLVTLPEDTEFPATSDLTIDPSGPLEPGAGRWIIVGYRLDAGSERGSLAGVRLTVSDADGAQGTADVDYELVLCQDPTATCE